MILNLVEISRLNSRRKKNLNNLKYENDFYTYIISSIRKKLLRNRFLKHRREREEIFRRSEVENESFYCDE